MSQISNKFLAQVPANTLKGNNTGLTANVTDLTISQVQTMLSIPTASSPLAIGSGGTGQTSAAAAFNALNPMTTTGDLIYESASNVASRLPVGSTGQVLTVVGGIPAWATATTGANQALSNLASVAINTSLLPGVDNTISVGSNTFRFANGLFGGTVASNIFSVRDSSTVNRLSITGDAITLPSGASVPGTIRNISPSSTTQLISALGLSTANGATAITGAILIETGNNSAAASGDILLTTGTANTTRGIISLNGSAINANTSQIHNVVDPTSPQDAATKAYVDASGASAITSLTGDVTATGPGAAAATLATVNSNVGSFGSSTSIPSFTVNAKGLITAASGNVVIAPAGTLSGTTLNSTVVTSSLTSLGAQSAALNMNSHQINNVSDPTSAQDAATKYYVDQLAQGLKPKQAVRAGSLADIDLTTGGLLTIDTVVLVDGDRVLVKDNTAPEENGIYIAHSGSWTRSPDFDSLSPIDEINGAYTFIQEGSQAGQGWVQQGTVTTIGVDPIVFVHFSSSTTVIGGDMITVTGGDTISVDLATVSGLESSNPGNPAGQLRAKVDAATVKINASNELEGLKPGQENITLSGGDITNQYVDLAFAVYGASASDNSIELSVVGGPMQLKAVDYTVSLTGGSGGVTRVTFAGDLATGGNAELVAADILMISYNYLT